MAVIGFNSEKKEGRCTMEMLTKGSTSGLVVGKCERQKEEDGIPGKKSIGFDGNTAKRNLVGCVSCFGYLVKGI